LSVGKSTTQKLDTERFNLKKQNKVEDNEQYQVKISNMFATVENLNNDVDINRARETIRENIKISVKENTSYYESRPRMPWFDEECSELLDQRKEAKLQWFAGSKPNKWG
jgi:hypothetical protein